MTFHAANFAAQWARETGEGSPGNPVNYPVRQLAQVGTFSVSGTGLVAPLTNPNGTGLEFGPVNCETIERVELVVRNDEGTPRDFHVSANKLSNEWTIVSDLAEEGTPNVIHNGVFANGGLSSSIIQPVNPLNFPHGGIFFDGAALAQFDAGGGEVPVDIIEGTLWLSDGSAQSLTRFSEFVDIPPDTANNVAGALDRLNRQFRNGTGRAFLGTTSAGQDVFAKDAAAALMPCSRRIFLRASDIGNQNEQIPTSVANNTPSHFRFFPGAFFRRTDYIRSLLQESPGTPDGTSIIETGAGFQPYTLSVVNRAPTQSAWRIIVDGVRHDIWISHPNGSDFRTALEIWNGVWALALQTHEPVLNPLPILGTWDRSGDPLAGSQRGLLHRIKYLQYAELLAVSDRQTGITTDTPQGDTAIIN